MMRAFGIDSLECPKCHGKMRLISTIDDPKVVAKILDHLGLDKNVPSPKGPRSPPIEETYDYN